MAGPLGKPRRFRLPLSENRVAREIDEEIAFHIDERTEDLVARGIERRAAREQAHAEFGDIGAARADLEAIDRRRVRRILRAGWWSDFLLDLRYGARGLMRAPLFSLLAVFTLAVGLGANAALFGVVKPVLLDPLPYADQERLVRIHGHNLESGQDRWGVSAGMIADVRALQRSFADLAAFFVFPSEIMVGTGDGVHVARAALVQPSFFHVLGVPPAQGRMFTDDDLPSSGPAPVVVLTHGAWQRYAGGDRSVLGSEMIINDMPRTVIGILPRGFVGPHGEAEFYFPLNLAPFADDPVAARRSYSFGMIARLQPEIGHAAAQRELETIAEVIQQEYPEDIRGIGLNAEPLRAAMVGDTRTPLLILTAGAALVLLIACANLAGALLSRVISRRREFAIRTALGAGRGRIVRQLLTESTVLAVAGGVVGVALAAVTLTLLRDLALNALPHFADLSLDNGVLLTVLLLTLSAGIGVGLLPALAAGRADVRRGVTEQSRGASEGRRSGRLRGILVAAQIALCLSLVASAGLLARSLWTMSTAPIGVEAENVVIATLTLPRARYGEPAPNVQFQEELVERLRALPGITSVATASDPPQQVMDSNSFVIEGRPWARGEPEPFVLWASVSDDYFRTLRIPVLEGRTFDRRDHADAVPAIVISSSMARRHWPAGDALGARIRLGPDVASPHWEVVGIVGDVRNDPARPDAEPITYVSFRQDPVLRPTLLARSQGDPAALLPVIEHELAQIDPGVPLQNVMPLELALSRGLAGHRLPVVLMLAFGALALLLASVGVYAMFATMVAAREREFGVRLALGAEPRAIARLVLRQGAVWMAVGLAVGAVVAMVAGYWMRGLLFGVSPFDPLTVTAAALLLLSCAALALLTPVWRAARVDPAVALRAE
jgi:putative ABC transport system permease protein